VLDANYTPTTTAGGMSGYDYAQTFTVVNSGVLTSVEMRMHKLYSWSGFPTTISVDIRTLAADGRPTEANTGANVLSSMTVTEDAFGLTADWVRFDLPDVPVTAGQQLAIVFRNISTPDIVWNGDVDWPSFGYATGTYAGGRAFIRGTSHGNATPATEFGDIWLYNSPTAPVGGAVPDFAFRTYVEAAAPPSPPTPVLDANNPYVYGNGAVSTTKSTSNPYEPVLAQSFTVVNSGMLTAATLRLGNGGFTGDPSFSVKLDVRRLAPDGRPTEPNSGPNILSSVTISSALISTGMSDVVFDLPDCPVTAGERLALVLSTTVPSIYLTQGSIMWSGDLNWPWLGSPPGTYAGGQAFQRGRLEGHGDGTPTDQFGNIHLVGMPWAGTGGGPLADFHFQVFVIPGAFTPAPVIDSATTASGAYGSSFSYTISAANSPTSFAANGLPPGLSINATTGVISGTPTQAGTFTVALAATNGSGTGHASLTLTINRATATVTLANLSHTFNGAVKSASAATNPAGLAVGLSYSGASLPPINAGSYGVIASVSDPNYTGSASGTLVIAQAPATVTLSGLSQSYDGTPKSITATTNPPGLSTAITYHGSPTAPTAVGSYAVVATVSNPNYTGSASGTLTIADTVPPVLSLPANLALEATSPAGAVATFSATANDNVSGSVPVSLSHPSGTTFPLGSTPVHASATDAAGNTATGTFTVTVHDTTAPVIGALPNLTVEATSAAGAVVTFSASATDAVSAATVTASPASGSTFPLGPTTVTVTARDAAGNTATGTFTVTVRDTTAPVIASLTPSRATLWPPNHQMVAVALTATASDTVGIASLRIVRVSSNEPDNGLGDGDVPNDIEVTGPLSVNLRAERAGHGSGRVYTITVEAHDAAGNSAMRTTTVAVPKSQGGR
jgi:hypothetical protein